MTGVQTCALPISRAISFCMDAVLSGASLSITFRLYVMDVMAQYKLVPTDVSAALAEQNIEAAPGQFGERGNQTFQYTIRYKGRLQQTTEFEDIVIKALPDGNVLRLGDVADIELGRLAYTFNNMVNGHKAVSCIVYQMAGSNATETISDLEKVLAKAQESLPTGLNINIAQNANDFLFASIHHCLWSCYERCRKIGRAHV